MFIDPGLQSAGTPLGVRCFRRVRWTGFRNDETDEHPTPKGVRNFRLWRTINIAFLRSEDSNDRASKNKVQTTKVSQRFAFKPAFTTASNASLGFPARSKSRG